MPPVVLRDVVEYIPPCVIRLQPSEDLDRLWGQVAATTGNNTPQPLPETPPASPLVQPLHPPVPHVPTLSPCGEFRVLAGGVTQVTAMLGDIRGSPMEPQDAGTGDLAVSVGSRLLDCPRLCPELVHSYSGWSLPSWAAAAICSAERGFSVFLHLLFTSFLLGWAGG